jgi:hypothetical protein
MADPNPYATPSTTVLERAEQPGESDGFIATGQIVSAGSGWHWFRHGWSIFRAQMGLWIAVAICFFLFSTAIQIIPILGSIASFFLTPVLLGGIMIGCHAIHRRQGMKFNDLFGGFSHNPGQLFLLALLEVVMLVGIVLVMVAIMGTGFSMSNLDVFGPAIVIAVLVALIAVSAYLAAIWFAPALIAINNVSALEAIGRSFMASMRNWRAFAIFGLVGIALAIPVTVLFSIAVGGFAAAAISAGGDLGSLSLGLIVVPLVLVVLFIATLGPVMFGTIYASYRDIFYRAG